ncbi:hypothetical protein [Streptomyces aureocirculatus]|uniref:hypothetical protein n=1 Tax=Streptomyces aureocirculatus TaxID=67275 RepID=UPI0018FEE9E2|nr:hypothetical protein [Streptomyces aureocirculatus]
MVSRAKVSWHGSLASWQGSAVTGTTIRVTTLASSAGIRGSAPANSRAASIPLAWTAGGS